MRTFLGLVLAVTPVALWIAWDATVLFAVMGVAVTAAALLVLLTPDEAGASHPATLPEGFVEDVQRLFPLTYHHSAAVPARFRRTMNRLRELLPPG